MSDYTFEQNNLTVKVGTEVKWLGNDLVMRTITAKDFAFSGALRPKGSFSHKFEEAGVYEYICGIHPSMKGRVEVTP